LEKKKHRSVTDTPKTAQISIKDLGATKGKGINGVRPQKTRSLKIGESEAQKIEGGLKGKHQRERDWSWDDKKKGE